MEIAIPMRVFNNSKGGKEIFTWNLVQCLAERGHVVHIVADDYIELEHKNIHFWRAPSLGKAIGVHRWTFSQTARTVVSDLDVDFVMSHGKAGFGEVVRIGGLPFQKHREELIKTETSVWKRLLMRAVGRIDVSKNLNRYLEAKSFDNPDLKKIIVASEFIRDKLQEQYPYLNSSGIEVIHNGVNCDEYHLEARKTLRNSKREYFSFEKDEMVFLFVGNDFQRKGFDRVVPVLHDYPDAKLLAVGRRDHFRRLNWESVNRKIRERVHFIGEVSDLRPYYAASDVLLFPTRSDGFGLVVLEALGMGLYVWVSKNCGASEIITENWQGKIGFETSTKHTLPEDFIRSENWLQKRENYAQQFSWDRVCERYIKRFKIVLKSKSKNDVVK